MGRVNFPPPLIGLRQQLESHRQAGISRAGAFGSAGAGFDGGEGGLNLIGRTQIWIDGRGKEKKIGELVNG